MLRPQDVFVLLKLHAGDDPTVSVSRLAESLSMSQSDVHRALKRAQQSGLLSVEGSGTNPHKRTVNRLALLEFLIHGVKYAYPPERGTVTRGVPTAWASRALKKKFKIASDDLPPVWPHPAGKTRGLEFSALWKTAPEATSGDDEFYELLALVDAIRGGRARERQVATRELEQRFLK